MPQVGLLIPQVIISLARLWPGPFRPMFLETESTAEISWFNSRPTLQRAPFPHLSQARRPLGSLIYTSTTASDITTATDTDTFTLSLDAGQTISLVAAPATGSLLQPVVTLISPSSVALATQTAAAAGQSAIIETTPVTAPGAYSIVVGGNAASLGLVNVQVWLNSAVEAANFGGPSDNSKATAQNIDASFVSLGGTSSRGAVRGTIATAGTTTVASEGFESGSLGPAWSTYSSDSTNGRIQLTGAYGTAGGSFAMVMDHNDSTGATYNLNEAIWTVNLVGLSQASLTFSEASYNDEVDTLPTTFAGHANGDGVAISADGVNWRTIWLGTSTSQGVYSPVTVDLAAAATAGGFSLGARISKSNFNNTTTTT